MTSITQELATTLAEISNIDAQPNDAKDYDRRRILVYRALDRALTLGFNAGVRIDPKQPEWPVVYIELPTGQVSWHQPEHETPFDGHSNPEKHIRVWRWIDERQSGRHRATVAERETEADAVAEEHWGRHL